jgi:hypothetical protein
MKYPALITLLLLTSMGSTQDRAFHLPFRDENGLTLLDLKVNGKPAVLLLDTGATTTLFANAGLVEIRVAEHSVIAVHANELGRFSSTTRRNMALLGIRGILGQDFLHKFKSVRIDYVNRVLELEPR